MTIGGVTSLNQQIMRGDNGGEERVLHDCRQGVSEQPTAQRERGRVAAIRRILLIPPYRRRRVMQYTPAYSIQTRTETPS